MNAKCTRVSPRCPRSPTCLTVGLCATEGHICGICVLNLNQIRQTVSVNKYINTYKLSNL